MMRLPLSSVACPKSFLQLPPPATFLCTLENRSQNACRTALLAFRRIFKAYFCLWFPDDGHGLSSPIPSKNGGDVGTKTTHACVHRV